MTGRIGDEPAFPYRYSDGADYTGMTLRDWFAGQAMTGLLSVEGVAGVESVESVRGVIFQHMAEMAYRQADAMLKARDTA